MCHFPLKLMNPTVKENKWAKRIEREKMAKHPEERGENAQSEIQIKSMECSRVSHSVKKSFTPLLTCIFN